jgi:hypothetical protein
VLVTANNILQTRVTSRTVKVAAIIALIQYTLFSPKVTVFTISPKHPFSKNHLLYTTSHFLIFRKVVKSVSSVHSLSRSQYAAECRKCLRFRKVGSSHVTVVIVHIVSTVVVDAIVDPGRRRSVEYEEKGK